MKDDIHEQLSALVDDELPAAEQALLIRQLASNTDLQQVLSRYQLVSDSLHGSLPERIDPGFHARVSAVLQQETALHTRPRMPSRWYRPLAGFAMAASVAVVAVVSLQNTQQEAPVASQALAIAPSAGPSFLQPGNMANVADVSTQVAPPISNRDLDAYLVNHNEFAVNSGMQGMLPYARIVGQDNQTGNAPASNK